ncbi:PspC domain-containing protein [Blastococcus brunescens]|uniref:PspC domain-containing protein n=1 Tax=Blastococcus brunescens TaxID=1564165 RepID=A0ABZ1AXA6_9ACTN|nr:PspC domain-containing protein [Blastococcus sp. BMG 8361]WRL63206.1 PspC domain-containing protein [Blastococcus sp. BMG 8361]
MTAPTPYALRRDSRNKVIGGVCAGIARRYGLSRNGLRLAFVLSACSPARSSSPTCCCGCSSPPTDGRTRSGGADHQVFPAAVRARPGGRRRGRRSQR